MRKKINETTSLLKAIEYVNELNKTRIFNKDENRTPSIITKEIKIAIMGDT